MGIDAEDGSPFDGHGPQATYDAVGVAIQTSITKAGGLVVFGCTPAGSDDVTFFWTSIATATGLALTCIEGAAIPGSAGAIAGASFIGVASSLVVTPSGGLTDAESQAMLPLQPDFAAHVNGGGGLWAFSQSGQTTAYGFLAGIGAFTFTTGNGYSDITATPAGTALGIDDSLDVFAWHDTYVTFPAFLGVLANINGGSLDGQIAAIGGQSVVIAQDGCTPGFWKNNGDKHEASAWVGHVPGTDGDSSFDATFGTDFPIKWADKGKPQSISDYSLQQALEANGGGLSLLARHGTAALLNAASGNVGYAFDEAAVIQLVQNAAVEWDANGNSIAFQDIVAQLTDANEQVCPINQQGQLPI